MASEIRVPTLGESVTEATIAQWYKKPGEAVSMDEPLCELETDKVTIEVPPKALAFWKRFCLRRARQWKLVLCWGQLMLRVRLLHLLKLRCRSADTGARRACRTGRTRRASRRRNTK